MKHRAVTIHSRKPPVVELDSEAHAACIRFSKKKVAKTELLTTEGCIVTVNLDSAGEVIGIELVGVDEFGVEPLLKKAGVAPISKRLAERTK